MSKVRWGLLSTAHINRRLIPAIRASGRGELVAVASRDLAKAKEYAAKWEIPQVFGDYQSMLNSGQVDAVYVSLPNHLHAEWSIRALHAGVHVLCEKPLATSLQEVDAMIAASQQSGCVLAEAFMYRHHPQTKIVGEWVHSGRLGDVTLVRGDFNYILEDRQVNVRMRPEYGGGSLWDVGVYPLSFAQFIFGGPPQRVFGMQRIGDLGVDEIFAGQMIYTNGGIAQIGASFRTPFYISTDIYGTLGRLSLNRPFVAMQEDRRLVFYPNQGPPQEIPVPEKELYLGEVEDMHAAILDGAQPYLSLQETRDHVRTVLALYTSAKTATVVNLV
ncbi:MAG: Gfo/Idh/MocA family oxidoreductase [Chloroflexota bacterium]